MPRKQPESPVAEPGVNTTDMMRFLDRVEKLEEEKKAIGDDIKEIWLEAKSSGYDTRMLRKAHALRKMVREDRLVLGIYAEALDLFS